MNLERVVWRCSLRFWFLVLNLTGNAFLLHGALLYVQFGTRLGELLAGAVLTVACNLILAIPNR
ncbi:MAG: hypothetical protein LC753_18650 [Acidobacteria bacterium]|nr:hypothetical protein [Acidobacteriota bacterium]MCA1652190.1 hypothetical protein [Acidobacteriota bacterium]